MKDQDPQAAQVLLLERPQNPELVRKRFGEIVFVEALETDGAVLRENEEKVFLLDQRFRNQPVPSLTLAKTELIGRIREKLQIARRKKRRWPSSSSGLWPSIR